MRISRTISAACASAVCALGCERATPPAQALSSPVGAVAALSHHEAWSRPADSGSTAAVYFTLVNVAGVSDTIIGVRSPWAEETGLHMSMQHGGTMHMAALRALPVPGKDSVLFRPLGAHVMLTRLSRSTVVGDTVPVVLTFASGQILEVRAGVRQP